MTRSEELDRGNAVLSTQQRKSWRSVNGQAHTYRTGNQVGGKGEVIIGCSLWSWSFDVGLRGCLVGGIMIMSRR